MMCAATMAYAKHSLYLALFALITLTTACLAIETSSHASDNGQSTVSNGSSAFALEAMYDNFTCVTGCTCQLVDYARSRYAVLCSGSSIRGIPAFLTEDLHQIESMTLLRTSITKIDSLRMFSNLLNLNLNSSLVQSLDSGMVTTFPAVESLHIAGSRLAQLTDFSLMRHPALRDIDFSANQLDSFDQSGSMSLSMLNLKGNLFTKLDDIGPGYAALRMLDAARNRLTLSSLIAWQPPPELEVLDLSGNQLGAEPGQSAPLNANASFLVRLRRLQQLDLSDNRLTSLQAIADWLPSDARLWKLSLAGNPFLCTCGLYKDKERLARQGVVIADTPTCRLTNGSDCPLMRLGNWACDEDGGATKVGPTLSPPEDLASAALRLPAALGLTAAAAAALAVLAVGGGFWACRRRRRHLQRQKQQHRQQELESECPYNTVSVKSTNLTGSQLSVGTYRSGMPYAFDPQRSRVFSRKLHPPSADHSQQQQQQQQQHMGSRCQSEQVLGRSSTPLPPIPGDSNRNAQVSRVAESQQEQQPPLPPPRPEAYSYIDMGGDEEGGGQNAAEGYQEMEPDEAGYMYDEVRPPTQRAADPPTVGYVEMSSSQLA